jgi:uncharacterized protein (TIGR02118 family)
MVKLIVLYPKQADPAAFDAHYFTHHAGLMKQLPGLDRMEAAKLGTGPETSNPHYLIAEMYFRDRDAMKAALKSPQMAACVKDLEENLKTPISVYLSDEIKG